MKIKLEKRPQPSRRWLYLSPILAVIVTMLAGGALFAALGKNPVEAIATIFWEPIFGEFAFYYRPQLLVKGAPLILIFMPWADIVTGSIIKTLMPDRSR